MYCGRLMNPVLFGWPSSTMVGVVWVGFAFIVDAILAQKTEDERWQEWQRDLKGGFGKGRSRVNIVFFLFFSNSCINYKLYHIILCLCICIFLVNIFMNVCKHLIEIYYYLVVYIIIISCLTSGGGGADVIVSLPLGQE